jgi:hypothetical protein
VTRSQSALEADADKPSQAMTAWATPATVSTTEGEAEASYVCWKISREARSMRMTWTFYSILRYAQSLPADAEELLVVAGR